jgi:hypothetical protein
MSKPEFIIALVPVSVNRQPFLDKMWGIWWGMKSGADR